MNKLIVNVEPAKTVEEALTNLAYGTTHYSNDDELIIESKWLNGAVIESCSGYTTIMIKDGWRIYLESECAWGSPTYSLSVEKIDET